MRLLCRDFWPELFAAFLLASLLASIPSDAHANGGSLYVLTVEPSEPRAGQIVSVTLSVGEQDPGPLLRFLITIESPTGERTEIPIYLEVNPGGFGKRTLCLPVDSPGTYRVTVEKESGTYWEVVSRQQFSVADAPISTAMPLAFFGMALVGFSLILFGRSSKLASRL